MLPHLTPTRVAISLSPPPAAPQRASRLVWARAQLRPPEVVGYAHALRDSLAELAGLRSEYAATLGVWRSGGGGGGASGGGASGGGASGGGASGGGV
eukprot:267047-Prymnesium_polylepis.1